MGTTDNNGHVRRWVLTACIGCWLVLGGLAHGSALAPWAALDAQAVRAQGEVWRLGTAHLAHFSVWHWAINTGLALGWLWVALRWMSLARCAGAALVSAAVVSAGLTWLPGAQPLTYAGASAAVWGGLIGTALWLALRPACTPVAARALAALIALVCCARLLWPLMGGSPTAGPLLPAGFVVHHAAHGWAVLGAWVWLVLALVFDAARGRVWLRAIALTAALFGLGGTAQAQSPVGTAQDAAEGRMLYQDTPLFRGSFNACVQCHRDPAAQRRGLTLIEQQDHIRCAIQGGCGGNVLAVYPLGSMAQFQGLIDGDDIRRLASYIREPNVLAAYPRMSTRTLEWSTVEFGQRRSAQVMLENRGERPLNLGAARVSGAATFAVAGGSCAAGTVLAPGASCSVVVDYAPACEVLHLGTVQIPHDGPLSPSVARLQGTAFGQPQPQLGTELLAAVTSDAGQRFTVRLNNRCAGTVRVTAIDFAGPFEMLRGAPSCVGQNLGLAQSCEVQVARTGTITGPASAGEIRIAHDGSNPSPQRVPLPPLAEVAAPLNDLRLTVTPTAQTGQTSVGQTRQWVAATIANTGAGVVNLQQVRLDDSPLRLVSTDELSCRAGTRLPAGGRCDVVVSFAPTQAGLFNANLTVQPDGNRAALTATLSAQAVADAAPGASGGGGGGAAHDVPLLLLLLGLGWLLRRQKH